MTLEEWLEWAVPLYTEFLNQHGEFASPSVSRYKDQGHYELGNLSILSMEDHRKLQAVKHVVIDGKKWCSGCKQAQAITSFRKNRSSSNGYANECAACADKSHKKWKCRRG